MYWVSLTTIVTLFEFLLNFSEKHLLLRIKTQVPGPLLSAWETLRGILPSQAAVIAIWGVHWQIKDSFLCLSCLCHFVF